MISLTNWVIISLGSNQGDSRKLLRAAADFLQGLSDAPLRTSSLWKSAPLDCPPGSTYFLNAIIALQPRANETPESLLRQLLGFEREVGRRPSKIRHAPRPLDLDLIAFGTERRRTKELILPHPRAAERRFVLEPLAELAPELILPGEARTVRQLLKSIGSDQFVTRHPRVPRIPRFLPSQRKKSNRGKR